MDKETEDKLNEIFGEKIKDHITEMKQALELAKAINEELNKKEIPYSIALKALSMELIGIQIVQKMDFEDLFLLLIGMNKTLKQGKENE